MQLNVTPELGITRRDQWSRLPTCTWSDPWGHETGGHFFRLYYRWHSIQEAKTEYPSQFRRWRVFRGFQLGFGIVVCGKRSARREETLKKCTDFKRKEIDVFSWKLGARPAAICHTRPGLQAPDRLILMFPA